MYQHEDGKDYGDLLHAQIQDARKTILERNPGIKPEKLKHIGTRFVYERNEETGKRERVGLRPMFMDGEQAGKYALMTTLLGEGFSKMARGYPTDGFRKAMRKATRNTTRKTTRKLTKCTTSRTEC